MAILCKECGAPIRPSHDQCDACGRLHPKARTLTEMEITVALLVAAAVLGYLGVKDWNGRATTPAHRALADVPRVPKKEVQWHDVIEPELAYYMTEPFVKSRLVSPGSAKFPGVFEGRRDHSRQISGQRYRVTSYVDSQNGFGAMLRTRFTGEIVQVAKDD